MATGNSAEQPPAYRDVVDALCADPEVTEAKMMGMASLRAGRSMFGGMFDGRLVVKLGRARVDPLIASGRAEPFDPSGRGRPMKDWAQVPEPTDDWLELAAEARALAAA
jgi:TfoX/Sxy family transcriptional regulator of competence genes